MKTTGSPQIKGKKWHAVLAVPGKDGNAQPMRCP